MSDLERIQKVLREAGRRRRWQRALNGLAAGALVGAILFVLALAAYKLLPIPARTVLIAGGAAAACALAGFLLGGWRSEPLARTARWVDDQQKLKERLSTALEVSSLPTRTESGEWKGLVLADASRHAEKIDVRTLWNFSLPGMARWAVVVLAVAAGLGFVPEYRTKAHLQKQQDAVVVKDVGRNLAELARRELAQKPPVLPEVQRSIEEIAELGELLGKHSLSKTEALKSLASATEKLAKQEQLLGESPAYKKLEQAARQPGNAASATPESIQKQMDSLQKSLGDAADKADKLDKLSRDLQKLQQQAQQSQQSQQGGNDGKAGEAARQQMAQSLAELARQAQQAGASLDGLEQAIEALQSNNVDQFVKDLDLAAHDLEKLQSMAAAMQQLQQQLSKLGKDLGEQLKYGQAQAAIQTLDKMIDQLKAANLPPDQLQKILDELKDASKPAEDYGKVAQYLKDALGQCRQGDKSGASKSLASAQDELKKLLEQMQDSEGLQSALASLERAQAAISSSQLWSQVQPGGKCKSCNGAGCARCNGTGRNWGHGGRPGRGVGTWADDEYGWTYFDAQQESGWDNSDIQRPDMEGKGLTDRPTDLSPNLLPDKVKGKMSPGGSMPAITLKGVSIKGTSNVKFEEAATAAQEDAQSALSQDRVPRAYQNAVRDYFDDLKK